MASAAFESGMQSEFLSSQSETKPFIFALVRLYWWGFGVVLPNTHYQRSQGAMTTATLYSRRDSQSTPRI